jgi:hypothetical protein
MIGYWETMDGDELLAEVNSVLNAKGLPDISLSSNGWQTSSTTELYHMLSRPFPKSPFALKHFWLDLRAVTSAKS